MSDADLQRRHDAGRSATYTCLTADCRAVLYEVLLARGVPVNPVCSECGERGFPALGPLKVRHVRSSMPVELVTTGDGISATAAPPPPPESSA